GRPLLSWVIEGAKSSKSLKELIVATDHQEIAAVAEEHGVRAVMTASDLPSGSDRVWAAARELDCEMVLNIQGDEPLLKPGWIDKAVSALAEAPDAQVSTLAHALPPEELTQDSAVKVICDRNWNAIYFSRFAIPYSRRAWADAPGLPLKHVGLYGYRKNFLAEFCAQAPTELERSESLEQLRALWMGAKIRVALIEDYSVGVDTADDAAKAEALLGGRK